MKKLLFVALLLAWAGPLPALAQRHVKHIAGLGAHIGRSKKGGNYYELSYTPMLTDHFALRLGGVYEYGNRPDTRGRYASYSGRLLVSPQLFRIGEFAYFHLLVGAGAGYEQTNVDGSGDLASDATKPERFTYGPQAGLEANFFLGNRISLVATATKSYLFNNPLIDEWPSLGSVGLRYHFR